MENKNILDYDNVSIVSIPPKVPKSTIKTEKKKISADEIHDGIRYLIRFLWEKLSLCEIVLIENQPIFNHTMRNVQMILYTSLREEYIRQNIPIQLCFVNARKKTGGKGKTYAERKHLTEEIAYTVLQSLPENDRKNILLQKWKSSKKKSDMADAICMCTNFAWEI